MDRSAVETLAEEGIEFCGLDETDVEVDVQKRQVRSTSELGDAGDAERGVGEQPAKAVSGSVSLRELATPDSPIAYSQVWHAACLLSLTEALRWEMNITPVHPEDREPWSDKEVSAKLQEVAVLGLEIGFHFHALGAAWLEGPASKHLVLAAARAKGAAARRGRLGEQTDAILTGISEAMARNSNLSLSSACGHVHKHGLGKSPEANRKLWYTHEGTRKQRKL